MKLLNSIFDISLQTLMDLAIENDDTCRYDSLQMSFLNTQVSRSIYAYPNEIMK